jgi:hypothetical protein
VESPRSVAQLTSYNFESQVAICDIRGKPEPPRSHGQRSHSFIHIHQQSIRSLSTVSPQPHHRRNFAIVRCSVDYESLGALLVVCGFFAQWASLSLTLGFAVATACSLKVGEASWFLAAYYTIIFATLTLTGPGRYSFDGLKKS